MTIFSSKADFLKNMLINTFKKPGLFETGMEGFSVSLRTEPTQNQHCFYKPMAIFVLQGEKRAVLGSETFTYHENEMVVTTIDIPSVSSITDASPEKPFLSLVLDLDETIINELLRQGNFPFENTSGRGMGMIKPDEPLLDAFCRLCNLIGEPEKQKILAPMIIKEIHYLLLSSPLGVMLRSVNTKGSQNNQIAKAIEWLKNNYRQPLKIDELAKMFNMSEASFYRHFNKVTSISPLQYQKQLRLHEAQRLMLTQSFDAAKAAYEVGYESASQFNREYKRMFGLPPKTNINQLKYL